MRDLEYDPSQRGVGALHVATRDSWQNLQSLPERRITVRLAINLDEREAERIRHGYIPADSDHKWFAYFDSNVLYVHRSWTGYCIDEIHFVATDRGLSATYAEVNRDPAQYGETDIEGDLARINAMVGDLARLPPGAIAPNSFDVQEWW